MATRALLDGGAVEDKVLDLPAWRLTRLCYQEGKALKASGVPILDAADGREHERLVREAVERGEDVPDHVLADYPDLVKTHYRHPHDAGETLCSRPIGDDTRVSHDGDDVDCGECLCCARRGYDAYGKEVALKPGGDDGPDESGQTKPVERAGPETPSGDEAPATEAPETAVEPPDDWTPALEDQAEFERWELELLTGLTGKKGSAFYRALKQVTRPGALRLALLQVNGSGDRRRQALIEERLTALPTQEEPASEPEPETHGVPEHATPQESPPEAEAGAPLFTPDDVIYVYTRAQAIEDGVLVDVSETARETGFRWPVALTIGVWALIENIPPRFQGIQDVEGRLWDVLSMARLATQRGGTETLYKLILHHGRKTYATLKLVSGPGDQGEPVITIMLPNED